MWHLTEKSISVDSSDEVYAESNIKSFQEIANKIKSLLVEPACDEASLFH